MKDSLAKFFSGKRVLVTGHTGFKGGWLTQILVNWGAEVVGISLSPHTDPNLFSILKLQNAIKNYFADIRDFESIKKIFNKEKPEIVFHLAAQALVRPSYDDPLHTIFSNTLGTANLLDTIRKNRDVRSAIIITTDKVYKNNEDGRPFKENDALGGYDPYSASKSAADIIATSYIKSFDLPVAVARAGNVIGGGDWNGDRLVPDIVRSFFEKKKLIIRYPQAVRPWQHVLEPLYGYMLLAKRIYEKNKDAVGEWNFGPDYKNTASVNDFLKIVKAVLPKVSYEVVKDNSKHEAGFLTLDSSRAREVLGWVPNLNLNETALSTFSWYKKYYNNPKEISSFTKSQIKSFFKL